MLSSVLLLKMLRDEFDSSLSSFLSTHHKKDLSSNPFASLAMRLIGSFLSAHLAIGAWTGALGRSRSLDHLRGTLPPASAPPIGGDSWIPTQWWSVSRRTYINGDVELWLVASWRFVVRGNGLSVNLGRRWERKSPENGRTCCSHVSRIRCDDWRCPEKRSVFLCPCPFPGYRARPLLPSRSTCLSPSLSFSSLPSSGVATSSL